MGVGIGGVRLYISFPAVLNLFFDYPLWDLGVDIEI